MLHLYNGFRTNKKFKARSICITEYTTAPFIMGTGQIKHLKLEAYVSGSTQVLHL